MAGGSRIGRRREHCEGKSGVDRVGISPRTPRSLPWTAKRLFEDLTYAASDREGAIDSAPPPPSVVSGRGGGVRRGGRSGDGSGNRSMVTAKGGSNN